MRLPIVAPLLVALSLTAQPIQILPFPDQIVTGRRRVRTLIESAAVARVVFSVDGKERASADGPPFSAVIDFGRLPRTQIVRAVALDARGRELGRSDFIVNHAGETFWLRLTEPGEGPASGTVRISAAIRPPAGHEIRRVRVSWNDDERAVMAAPPWQTTIEVPPGAAGIVRAVAELDDGRTAEDAVLLNGAGFSERSDVPLVELPVTIRGGPVRPAEVIVREKEKRRTVESIITAAEAPLTVGMLIDTSASMLLTLSGLQKAALQFLDTMLDPRDRAFLIAFSSEAQLLQRPTTDRERLRRHILNVRSGGDTSLHDAMILGLLQFEGVKGRRALVVFSDGADSRSRYHNNDVAELARRSNIPIYVLAAVPPRQAPPSSIPLWTIAVADLTRVTESTGGWTHRLHDLATLGDVYRRIAADLRAQSVVVIRTDPGRSENDWRPVEVQVPGRTGVRAPQGYYAPW